MANWADVAGYEGKYRVSDEGEVYSLLSNKVLRACPHPQGYPQVVLHLEGARKTWRVHRLVAQAFLGPAPRHKPLALHRDGDASNPRADNLYWGDYSDNLQDSVSHGTHPRWNSSKTHCPHNHEYTEENTWVTSRGDRECRTCRKTRSRKGLDPQDSRHGTANGYRNYGCRCQPCTTAQTTYMRNRRAL